MIKSTLSGCVHFILGHHVRSANDVHTALLNFTSCPREGKMPKSQLGESMKSAGNIAHCSLQGHETMIQTEHLSHVGE